MVTPLPTTGEGNVLAASGNSFSDIDSAAGDIKPKIKIQEEVVHESNMLEPLSSVDSFANDVESNNEDYKVNPPDEEETAFEFVPLPPFKLDKPAEEEPIIKEEPKTPPKNVADTQLDPTHLLRPSPVSPVSSDDLELEPLPFSHEPEPFPLEGAFASDFLDLFDEMSGDTQVGLQVLGTAVEHYDEVNDEEVKQKKKRGRTKKKSTKAKLASTKGQHKHRQPVPQYHWHHPYAMYPMPPSYTPYPYAPPSGYHFPPAPPKAVDKHKDGVQGHHRSFVNSLKSNSHEDRIYPKDVTDFDVVCGRGGQVNNHPGNKRFRKFIAENKMKYLQASKHEKPALADEILQLVKPGRFLVKMEGSYYVECNDARAREKASQSLREGAAQLRKEGYGADQKLKVAPKIRLPNERVGEKREHNYSEDPVYHHAFEPPRKKIKTVEV